MAHPIVIVRLPTTSLGTLSASQRSAQRRFAASLGNMAHFALRGAGLARRDRCGWLLCPADPAQRRWLIDEAIVRLSRSIADIEVVHAEVTPPRFERPVIIAAAPRSGSTMLFSALAGGPGTWTIGGESHAVIEAVPRLRPSARATPTHRLTATDAQPEDRDRLRLGFAAGLRDRDGDLLVELDPSRRPTAVRMLEKTPRNALRLPLLRALWPDARVVVLIRDPRESIASLIEAWRTWNGMRLDGWSGGEWKGLLPPGWPALNGRPVEEVAAFQWSVANRTIVEDLATWPRDHWCMVEYSALARDPARQVGRICRAFDLPMDDRWANALGRRLPVSASTISPPNAEKWRHYEQRLRPLLPDVRPLWEQLQAHVR